MFSLCTLVGASHGRLPRASAPGLQPQCFRVGVMMGTEGLKFSLLWPRELFSMQGLMVAVLGAEL